MGEALGLVGGGDVQSGGSGRERVGVGVGGELGVGGVVGRVEGGDDGLEDCENRNGMLSEATPILSSRAPFYREPLL